MARPRHNKYVHQRRCIVQPNNHSPMAGCIHYDLFMPFSLAHAQVVDESEEEKDGVAVSRKVFSGQKKVALLRNTGAGSSAGTMGAVNIRGWRFHRSVTSKLTQCSKQAYYLCLCRQLWLRKTEHLELFVLGGETNLDWFICCREDRGTQSCSKMLLPSMKSFF